MQHRTITLVALATLAALGLAARPAAAQQSLYVASSHNSTIEDFSSTGTPSTFANNTSQPGSLNGPYGLAFDSAGNLYVANRSTIEKFTTVSGVTTASQFASTGLSSPFGLAIDSAGNLYVANGGNNTIEELSSAGTASTFYSGTGLNLPYGLAFDSAGNLYAANAGNSTIEKFTINGGTVTPSQFASTGLSSPRGLAFDSTGNLYVANAGNSTIEEFSSAGAASTFYSGAGLSGPVGLAFDSAGNLYAANSSNSTIEKFTINGGTVTPSQFANSGLNQPAFLAFGPVAAPEPSPAAVLAIGLIGLGALALKAKRRRA